MGALHRGHGVWLIDADAGHSCVFLRTIWPGYEAGEFDSNDEGDMNDADETMRDGTVEGAKMEVVVGVPEGSVVTCIRQRL